MLLTVLAECLQLWFAGELAASSLVLCESVMSYAASIHLKANDAILHLSLAAGKGTHPHTLTLSLTRDLRPFWSEMEGATKLKFLSFCSP